MFRNKLSEATEASNQCNHTNNCTSAYPVSVTCTKNPKTKLSIDMPRRNVQVGASSSPGAHGDGWGVHPTKEENASSYFKNEFRIKHGEDGDGIANMYPHGGSRRDSSNCLLEKGKSLVSLYRKIDDGLPQVIEDTVNGIARNWYQADGGGAITQSNYSSDGNDSDPESEACSKSYEQELSSHVEKDFDECRTSIPKNLILHRVRDCKKGFKCFRKLFPICNPTSSLYAFKICLHGQWNSSFTASPSIGLLRPHRDVFVEVTTSPTARFKTDVAVNCPIEINIFPASCMENDPEKIYKSYQLLSQCPGLIHKQVIDRIILWDNGNLKSNVDFLNSIKDEDERQGLKNELYFSRHAPRDRVLKDKECMMLRMLKQNLLIANFHLRKTFDELNSFRNYSNGILFVCVFLTIVSVVIGSIKNA